jgi:predicted Zn-dependent protease
VDVWVHALDDVDAATLDRACATLQTALPVRCAVAPVDARHHFVPAWVPARGQLDARAALEHAYQLALTREPSPARTGAQVHLWLTTLDAYAGERPFVFGLASLTDRVALVSLARLADPEHGDPARTWARMDKVVVHEVGHALGLGHHEHADCVMRTDGSTTTLDDAPTEPCQRCRQHVQAASDLLARPGQLALDRARSHLVRGEIDRARRRFVDALWRARTDVALLHGFATAFLQAGQWNDAISVLQLVLELEPALAQAHVDRGVALQRRDRPGDREAAASHYERAVALRPEWTHVADHLSELRAELRAKPPAKPPARVPRPDRARERDLAARAQGPAAASPSSR